MNTDVRTLDVTTIKENQLPAIITTQFDKLTVLEDNVQEAVNLAVSAKRKAENAQVSAGLFKKKAAIELLQDATQGLAKAQMSMADAQKLSFEYQTKLTEITKFLFGLGVSNIAMNRSVVRELELRLKGASEEDISELAKQELRNVILQLKAQEDIMKKQEDLTGKLKEQASHIKHIDKQLDAFEDADEEQDEKIAENAEKLTEHSEALSKQQKKDTEHDQQIVELRKENDEQDEQISENSEKISSQQKILEAQQKKDTEHDQQIVELRRENDEQDEQISENSEKISSQQKILEAQQKKDAEHDRQFEEIAADDDKQDTLIEQNAIQIQELQKKVSSLEKWRIITSVVSISALILSLLQVLGVI